ncbi:MAG: hypothetical protein WC657_00510 [Candidatus Paceibacterota bacterium]
MTVDFRAPIGLFLLMVMGLAFLDMAIPKIFSTKTAEPQCVSRYIGERGIWIDRAKDNPKQNFCK